jgi:hypothetical protein
MFALAAVAFIGLLFYRQMLALPTRACAIVCITYALFLLLVN